jgi:hypothetical protein
MERADVLLKVAADDPGREFVLEADKTTLPLGGAMGALVGGAIGALAALASAAAGEERLWRPWRVRADRAAGQLTIGEYQVVRGEERSESIALASVERLVVRTVYRRRAPRGSSSKAEPFSITNPRHAEAIVHFRDGGEARQKTVPLDVLGIDTVEKVADLAYRLGTAMGLRFQHVLRSDPRRFEVEMTGARAPGFDALPVPEAAADYAAARAARAAAEAARLLVTPALDVARFPSDWRVTRWAPGDEVQFDRPLQGSAFGCLFVAAAGLLLGPAVWFMFRDTAGTVVTMLVVTTLVGLLISAIAGAVAVSSLAQRTRISWSGQSLTMGHALRRRQVRLGEIRALELRCVRRRVGGDHDTSSAAYTEYLCALRAILRAETGSGVELVRTNPFRRDPETPYDAALPLTAELAKGLGVEWTVTDYD